MISKISKYRVDFYRLARTMSEISSEMELGQFIKDEFGSNIFEKIKKHGPDGYILDTVMVFDKSGLCGVDIMNKHVIPHFKEATISSWDEVEIFED